MGAPAYRTQSLIPMRNPRSFPAPFIVRPGRRVQEAGVAPTRAARGSLLSLVLLGLISGCATNPATGERMFTLVSESQEIQMGREAAPQITASMGSVPDPELQSYVSDMGLGMAARSERPSLPWEFTVLDDPLVNAFALPGGYIFVTRGILAYMRSEAELAGVLGHEIGHVTARHSVSQISRQQLLDLGTGVGMILSPTVRANAALLGQSLQLVTLKFGRDAEMESDDLGLRYMTGLGYDPRHHASVFVMLGEVSGGDGSSTVPGWLSTHPNPEDREGRILAQIETRVASGEDFSGATRGEARFLEHLDGLVFGEDPREGFFDGPRFHHPELAFRIRFPDGWRTQNSRQAVVALSPEEDALVALTLAGEGAPSTHLREFMQQAGIQTGSPSRDPVNGLSAASARFGVVGQEESVEGVVTFVANEGVTYRVLGYTLSAGWVTSEEAIRSTLQSFQRETDPAILAVQPYRLEVVQAPSAMTMSQFIERFPSALPDEAVARLNRRGLMDPVMAGESMKRVVGGR